MKNHYEQALNQYKNIDLQARIEEATPYELILLLLQGARSHISSAINHIEHKQLSQKGERIGKAISILDELRHALNHDVDPQMTGNLDQLYDYIQRILLKANLDNSTDLLREAAALLGQVHTAWLGVNEKASGTTG
ncbi:flagellar export chaperone FliS [Legionella sp. W05-934-2]|jgi:flagellar protein FliS|uniref:flagellar export chaperone FliS n=1 Tax=Legionella sp. W05-934-2 TaxID=1198649 RepID=UPI003462A5E0